MEDLSIEAQRRAVRYWNVDGLPELYVGLSWLTVPLYLYSENRLPKGSLWHALLIVSGTLAIMILPLAGSLWLLPALKRRITWPRTGYVAVQKPKSKPYWAPLLFLPLVSALLFVPATTILPLTGLLSGASAAFLGRSASGRCAYVFGGLICALSIALGLAGVAIATGMGLLFGTAGAITVLSGGWTLRRYLKQA
jgi:hypothetical protein